MSSPAESFMTMLIGIPLLMVMLMFGACEMMCNSVGYTIGTSVVGPYFPSSEPQSEDEELAWKCAGFRRKSSGEWGYSGEYDHAACRAIRDQCEETKDEWNPDHSLCGKWESIQEGKVGWGKDNIMGDWVSANAKVVSVETLTGEPKKSKKERRRRRRPRRRSRPEAQTNSTQPVIPPATMPRYIRRPERPPVQVPRNPLIAQLERAMMNHDKEALERVFALVSDSIVASAEAGLRDKVLADATDLIEILTRNDMPFEGKQQSIREMRQARDDLLIAVNQAKQREPSP